MTNKAIETIIAELWTLETDATPGPWDYDCGDFSIYSRIAYDDGYPARISTLYGEQSIVKEDDVEFICAARNHLPALLDHIATLEAEIERLKAEQDNPNPLTLEELRERDGKPVWVKHLHGSRIGWGFVNVRRKKVSCYDGFAIGFEYFEAGTHIAYDRPPKEDEHERIYRRASTSMEQIARG